MVFDSFEIVDHPDQVAMPLIQLARHIFSICANSASCERLFSAFGNILTRLRNRMGKDVLQTLAEIKMHVRDEHLAHTEMKNRLKRRFGTVDLSSTPQHGVPLPPPPSSARSGDVMQASQNPMSLSTPGPHPAPPSSSTSNDLAEPTTENVPADDQSTQLLSTLIDRFIEQEALDHDESEMFIPLAQINNQLPVQLEDLFDFTRSYWIRHHQRSGRRSLNEELEMYNLLDMDLPGEEGAEVAIDDTIGDILTLQV